MSSSEPGPDPDVSLVAEIERLRRRLDRERSARREAERIAEDATRSSIEDPLTGLANRRVDASGKAIRTNARRRPRRPPTQRDWSRPRARRVSHGLQR